MKKLLIVVCVLAVLAAAGFITIQQLASPEKVKTLIEKTVLDETGRKLSINGEIKPSYSLAPTLLFHDISLSNADWGTAENLISADKLAVSFKLLPLISGKFEVSSLSLSGAAVALERKGELQNWKFIKADKNEETDATNEKTANAPSGNNGETFTITRAVIRDSSLSYLDHKTGAPLQLKIDTLSAENLSAKEIGMLHMDGQFEQAIIKASAKQDKELLMLDASISGAAQLSAKGSVSLKDSAFDLQISAKAQQLKHLLSMFGNKSESTAPVSFSGSIGGTPKLIKISEIQGIYAEQAFKTIGKIDLSQKKPYIEAAVTLPSIELSSTVGPAIKNTANTSAPANDNEKKTFSKKPLPLDALAAINASIALKVGSLKTNKLTLSNISAEANLHNNRLEISNVKAGIGEGSIAGKMTLDTSKSPAAVKVSLDSKDLDLGNLLSDMAQNNSVTGGKTTSSLNIISSGNSLHEIAASANGTSSMYVEKASYQEPQSIKQVSSFFDAMRGSEGSNEPMKLQCAITDWKITDGVAESNVIVIKSDSAIVNGKGNINLKDETMRIGLKARSSAIGLADVVPPLVIAGAWKNPSVTLDAKAGLMNIGKFALGAATGVGVIAVIGEQVTDKLGITADNNPCLKAITEAQENAAKADNDPKAAYKDAEDNVRAIRDDVKTNVKTNFKDAEKDVKAIRDGLKGLFKK